MKSLCSNSHLHVTCKFGTEDETVVGNVFRSFFSAVGFLTPTDRASCGTFIIVKVRRHLLSITGYVSFDIHANFIVDFNLSTDSHRRRLYAAWKVLLRRPKTLVKGRTTCGPYGFSCGRPYQSRYVRPDFLETLRHPPCQRVLCVIDTIKRAVFPGIIKFICHGEEKNSTYALRTAHRLPRHVSYAQ